MNAAGAFDSMRPRAECLVTRFDPRSRTGSDVLVEKAARLFDGIQVFHANISTWSRGPIKRSDLPALQISDKRTLKSFVRSVGPTALLSRNFRIHSPFIE
jgi:hypothetical protein